MEAKLAEKEGSELDRAIERLDHFKSIQTSSIRRRCISGFLTSPRLRGEVVSHRQMQNG